MSTIADYSVFTKAFLASTNVDFSKPYGKLDQDGNWGESGLSKAFAVVPLALDHLLTPREAMNFDWSELGSGDMRDRIYCHDADGNFIGNIVRIQPGVREGSIRLVAKVAIPAANGEDVADLKVNTFVLLRTDPSTSQDLPIAVATISAGYRIHKHLASGNDPLDDVENANYVSFTINHLNGYTSVDFNPDAYATYDDVENALSRGIDGLHIAFDTASGDLKLLDKEGNVLDQANLPIKTDVIIADGEEGYKYVKTDVKQDIHAAKAWMPEGSTAWDSVEAVPYTMQHAALVVDSSRVFVDSVTNTEYPISTDSVDIAHVEIAGSTYMVADISEGICSLFKIKGDSSTCRYQGVKYSGNDVALTDGSQCPITTGSVEEVAVIKHDETTYVLGEMERQTFQPLTLAGERNGNTGSIKSTGEVLGITPDGTHLYTFDEGAQSPTHINNISGGTVRWLDKKNLTDVPNHTLKYGLEAFVWTVKDREVKLNEPFFNQLNASLLALGFHEGDDIALGTNLTILAPTEGVSPLNRVDADDYMHGKGNKAKREKEVNTQRANAKEELVAWNAQHPTLTEDREHGTIIDHTGLDVRNGSITLGCGRVGKAGVYGIQMEGRSQGGNISGSLDFTISHTTGNVTFDDNGHAANLTSSTLLSIEPSSYISGAPTCLILAKVTRKPKEGDTDPLEGSPVLTPIRMTAGFSVDAPYDPSDGLTLTIYDYRDNIKALLNPDGATSIIEVQAIYTHQDARNETVPAQQMHTYIGEWNYTQTPACSFSCNKIEEWMTAVGLADPNASTDVKLYVVIRVY